MWMWEQNVFVLKVDELAVKVTKFIIFKIFVWVRISWVAKISFFMDL